MKKYQTILLVVLVVAIAGVLFWLKKDRPKDDIAGPVNTNQQIYTEQKIERNKVGPFSIRSLMPSTEVFAEYGYEVREKKGEGIVEGAEGGPRGSAFVVSRGGKELFIIYPVFGKILEGKIWEFKITSPEFKTSEGLGVGATISDFIETYPDYSLWYTYVGDWFVLETPKYKGVQFKLDENGFLSTQKDITRRDQVALLLSDFNPETKITDIRIYYFPD